MNDLILIIGDDYYSDNLMENSLIINEQVNERSTCSFSLKTAFYKTIEKGMPVRIVNFENDEEDILFNGFIQTSLFKDYGHNSRIYNIECCDLHYLVDKRIYVRGFVDISSGDIIRQMVDEVLKFEGITIEDIYDDLGNLIESSVNNGIQIPALTFNYIKCSEVMDQLAELNGYIWYIDYNSVIHFKEPALFGESPTVTDAVVFENSLKIQNKNNSYRNKQFLKGSTAETDEITQIFKGNPSGSYALGYKLAQKPKIWINGVYVYEDDIVQKNYDKEDAKFLYEKLDNVILQNPTQEPLTEADEVKIVYKGSYRIVAITESRSEIERNYQLGSGTGIVEECDTEELDNLNMAISTAIGRLSKYTGNSYQVTFKTRSKGFDVGQKLTFDTSEWKDNDYVIESITITDNINTVWYTVKAVKGALCESWAKAFASGLVNKPSVPPVDVSEVETVVLNETVAKTWILEESPNIFHEIFADGTVITDGSKKPAFAFSERIRFVEVIGLNDKILSRHFKSIQTDPSLNSILTYFYIDTFSSNAKWCKLRFYGGYQANYDFNTGVVIDEIEIDLTKTSVESIQIARTDVKGW